MKLYLRKEERDYSLSGGLFHSSQLQDVEILNEDKTRQLSKLVITQSYSHTNQWGTHTLSGRVDIKYMDKGLREYLEGKYGEIDLQLVNELFTPINFTKEDELEEIEI